MKNVAYILLSILACQVSDAQTREKSPDEKLLPKGWANGTPANAHSSDYVTGLDTTEKHSGEASAYIKLVAAKSEGFSTLSQGVRAENYRGKRVRLSAFVKARDVEHGALWFRVDTVENIAGFDNMDKRPIMGTTDWKKYQLVLDVPQDAVVVPFGFMLMGNGELWADDFQLDVVGPDVPVTDLIDFIKGQPSPYKDAEGRARLKRMVDRATPEPVNVGFEDGIGFDPMVR
jgi:hypothetical protein